MSDYDETPVHQAADAEVSVLGAAMLGADIDDLAAIIDPGDFYHPSRSETWAAICRVHAAGNKPDPVSVRMALDNAKIKHDPIELLRYIEMTPIIANAAYYAREVAEKAGDRRLETASVKVRQIATAPGDLDERRERARQVLDEACRGRNVAKARTIADLLPAVIDTAQHGQASVLGTGWTDLDYFIGGLAPGRLIVIGARPGVGKSIAGTNLALHVASHHDHAVLLASLEMPELEVGQRMLASWAQADLGSLQNGRTDEATWARISAKSTEMAALPITVNDTPDQTVTSIRRSARDVQRTRDDLALIVVDYLQLVRPSDTKVNRSEQIGEISRGLKLLARESGACVVAMAQVNRDSAKRNDRPRMSDLRESGSIEADADQVILLHQPDEGLADIDMIVDKNRHGPKGQARLQIQGNYARLTQQWTQRRALG